MTAQNLPEGFRYRAELIGETVGVSLLSPCVLRLRRRASERKWERANLTAEPRSAYLLAGPARAEWEHSFSQLFRRETGLSPSEYRRQR